MLSRGREEAYSIDVSSGSLSSIALSSAEVSRGLPRSVELACPNKPIILG